MSSVRLEDAYAVGGAAPRGISTTYSIPLDGKPFSLGPFPFTPRGISIVNQTSGVVTVNDDRGASYVANSLTATTFGLGSTLYLTAQVSPAQPSGKVTVIVYDSPQAIASAQLAALAPSGSNIQRVSSLPSSPTSDQIVTWEPDPVNFPSRLWTVIWSVARNRWETISATPLRIFDGSNTGYQNTLGSTWQRVWNGITVPRTGLYRCSWEHQLETTNTGDDVFSLMADAPGSIASPATRARQGNDPGNADYTTPAYSKELTLTQGNVAQIWMETISAGLANVALVDPALEIVPIYFV